MAKPGVVLRRAVGSTGRFSEHAELPTDLAEDDGATRSKRRRDKSEKRWAKFEDETARKAAHDFEKEQRRRVAQRRKEEPAREKERVRRDRAVAEAQADLEKAKREHDARAAELEAERTALDERAKAEDAGWEKQREKPEAALRRASD